MAIGIDGDGSNNGSSNNSPSRLLSSNNKIIDENRVKAAILGALLADAASMGTHNIDDPNEIKNLVGDETTAEFKSPPTPKGYNTIDYPGHYETGMLSPWGEQLLFATEYCGKHKCVTAGHMSVRFKEWAEDTTKCGMQDKSIQEFLHCMKAGDRSVEVAGANDDRAYCYAMIVPVVCLYAGEVDMLERVQEAIMVSQTNPKAIRFGKAAASLLESILKGVSLKVAMEHLVEHTMSSTSNFSVDDDSDIGDACIVALMEAKSKETTVQLMEEVLVPDEENAGDNSGRFPAAFVEPMFLFYKAIAEYGGEITEESYVKAIRANIMAGGDTCCRAILLGAVLGAAAGKVPDSFLEKFVPQEALKKVEEATAGIIEAIG